MKHLKRVGHVSVVSLSFLALFLIGVQADTPYPGVTGELAPVSITTLPDFVGSHKAAPEMANAGSVITYTIVTVNSGAETKEDVALIDVLPDGVEYVPGSCTHSAGVCQRPPGYLWESSLAPGERITTAFAVAVSADLDVGDELVNRAYLDWGFYRHPLSCTTVITSRPDFSTSYMTGLPTAEIGARIPYTIVVGNTGTSAAEQVVLSDTLRVEHGDIAPYELVPDGCTYEDGSGSWECWDYPGRLWEENFAPGDRITTVLVVRVLDGPGTLTNRAHLQWNASDLELAITTVVPARAYLPVVLRQCAGPPDR